MDFVEVGDLDAQIEAVLRSWVFKLAEELVGLVELLVFILLLDAKRPDFNSFRIHLSLRLLLDFICFPSNAGIVPRLFLGLKRALLSRLWHSAHFCGPH